MTWALCLSCGEVKFGAICPCPNCNAKSTGDMSLDIAFSDHNIAKESLYELGAVVASIRETSTDDELCFWTFIRYVSVHHASILGVELDPDVRDKCDAILEQIQLPTVVLKPSPHEEPKAGQNDDQRR